MEYNIKPSAPPLDTINENNISRGEGETITHWANNSNQQPVRQPIRQPVRQPVQQPVQQQVYPAFQQQVYPPSQKPVQQNQIYTYTSFPYSYPANRPPFPPQTFRLPMSTQINYATKQGQNCVCIYCRNYQKTRVKSKCSLFSYLCAFGLLITGCCCFYPCFHQELKNKYHYCSHCRKLLGHS